MKIAVLGGGLSGLSLAAKLEENKHEVKLFEKEARFGGLCKTDIIDNHVFDLHGGHVFNSKFKEVKDWVFSLLPEEQWEFSERKALIEYKGRLINYPFELSLAELDPEEAADCILDFLKCDRTRGKPDNFHDWLNWMFGRSISEKYMIPYNMKVWDRDLKTMGISWIDGKMPLPNDKELLLSALTKDSHERMMPHSTFYYPKEGGIQSLIDALSKKVSNKVNNYRIQKIEKQRGKWYVDGETFDHLVSTIPLPELCGILIGINDEIKQIMSLLSYNSISTSIFKYKKSNISWIYYPSSEKGAHRTVFQGNLAKGLKGSITFEKTGKCRVEEQIRGFEISMNDFIKESFAQYAYVVCDKETDKKLMHIRNYFDELGLGLVGRFAEWKYYNMDNCIKAGFDYISRNKL